MQKKTLILGASLKPDRYANIAIRRLVAHKIEVVAVGNVTGEVAGVTIEKGLPNFESINTVSIYLRPSRQSMYYDYIISLKPKRVIFNPGTENTEFITLLNAQNIETEIACTLVMISTNQY